MKTSNYMIKNRERKTAAILIITMILLFVMFATGTLIFKIIGWVLVAIVGFSILYSSIFHYRNYQNAQWRKLGDEKLWYGHRHVYRRLIWIQVIKLAIIVLILFFLL